MNLRKQAFTLIELLVVISIILIASSIIFIGGSGGVGNKLSSSQRIVSGIAQGARGQAILKNATSRLIIYSDVSGNQDEEKMLRYFGIVVEESPGSDRWLAATQGTYLPEGIYFNPTLSEGKDWDRGNSKMNLQYPRQSAQPGSSGEEYYFFEFNSNGTMARGYDNNWLVLQAGSLRPGTGNALEVNFEAEENAKLLAGLIFRRTGTTTPVNDPSDID